MGRQLWPCSPGGHSGHCICGTGRVWWHGLKKQHTTLSESEAKAKVALLDVSLGMQQDVRFHVCVCIMPFLWQYLMAHTICLYTPWASLSCRQLSVGYTAGALPYYCVPWWCSPGPLFPSLEPFSHARVVQSLLMITFGCCRDCWEWKGLPLIMVKQEA
jgi:hypothetical protein